MGKKRGRISRTGNHVRHLKWMIVLGVIAVLVILELLVLRKGWATERKPVFYTEWPEAVSLKKEFVPGDCYITNKVTGLNRYYIDDQSVLWGYGDNGFGQLGTGEVTLEYIRAKEPVWIAENVVSVDCAEDGYFCIFLTADGELYGMGSNMRGMLSADQEKEKNDPINGNRNGKISRPVLLMDEVRYARAGKESIAALKQDGSVWWWGQYSSSYKTNAFYDGTLWKMEYGSPHKMLDNCIYVTTGDYMGAAITKEGGLYTWGFNIFGQCGTKVTEDDYLREPCKVLDNVRMVWPEKMEWNSIETVIPEKIEEPAAYTFNTFVQLKDGTLLAAGKDLGRQKKRIAITDYHKQKSMHLYSDEFIPVKIETYNRDQIVEKEDGLQTPDKETVLLMRGIALEGMREEDIKRVKEVVKQVNLRLEAMFIDESDLTYNWKDPESAVWNVLEQTGEVVIGYVFDPEIWEQRESLGLSRKEFEEQYGGPIYIDNAYDAERMLQVLSELQASIQNEKFRQNFANVADLLQKATETHDFEYIREIYHIFHDMDYYLLRYGMEDVGKYVEDTSTIAIYNGVLEDYRGTDYSILE